MKRLAFLFLLFLISDVCVSQDYLVFCAKKKVDDEDYFEHSSLFTIRKDCIIITQDKDSTNQRFAIIRKQANTSEGYIKYYFGKYDCVTWYPQTGLIFVQKNFKNTVYSKCSE